MKHLDLELEKLEQRIAPGLICFNGHGTKTSKSRDGHSKTKGGSKTKDHSKSKHSKSKHSKSKSY